MELIVKQLYSGKYVLAININNLLNIQENSLGTKYFILLIARKMFKLEMLTYDT